MTYNNSRGTQWRISETGYGS